MLTKASLLKAGAFGAMLTIASPLFAQDPNRAVQSRIEKIFAISVALTDSEAVSVGFVDFDPNSFINFNDNEFGTEDTIDARKQVSVGVIPYTSVVETSDPDLDFIWAAKLSYVSTDQDVELSSNVTADPSKDNNQELILGAYGFVGLQSHLSQRWALLYGLGIHTLYYRNTYEYNNSYSQQFQEGLDGYALNTSAWSVLGEPSVKLRYLKPQDWGSWNVSSRVRYFYGFGGGEANSGEIGNPEGLRFINEVEFKQDIVLDTLPVKNPQIHYNLRRIDVAGDLTEPLDTHNYYEFGAGLVFDIPYDSYFFYNVGIGINFNYGSSLSGGSLLFLFNS